MSISSRRRTWHAHFCTRLPVNCQSIATNVFTRVLTDNIQACLNGSQSPEQAMADAQSESDRILRAFRKA